MGPLAAAGWKSDRHLSFTEIIHLRERFGLGNKLCRALVQHFVAYYQHHQLVLGRLRFTSRKTLPLLIC